jgi:predicted adenine nucleotide alpha hydrolase (AANH) superfamily ATPase
VRWTSLPASGAKVARVAAREDRRDWTAVSKGVSWSPEKSKRCCRCGTIAHLHGIELDYGFRRQRSLSRHSDVADIDDSHRRHGA